MNIGKLEKLPAGLVNLMYCSLTQVLALGLTLASLTFEEMMVFGEPIQNSEMLVATERQHGKC